VGSQFWDLDFTQGASHHPRPGIFLAHDFQDMDRELGDFTVSEGHMYSLVYYIFAKKTHFFGMKNFKFITWYPNMVQNM
jgi:hypothetical protein